MYKKVSDNVLVQRINDNASSHYSLFIVIICRRYLGIFRIALGVTFSGLDACSDML